MPPTNEIVSLGATLEFILKVEDANGNIISPVTQVAAGHYHNCGLRTDGSVACWGHDYFGQSSPPVTRTVSAEEVSAWLVSSNASIAVSFGTKINLAPGDYTVDINTLVPPLLDVSFRGACTSDSSFTITQGDHECLATIVYDIQ